MVACGVVGGGIFEDEISEEDGEGRFRVVESPGESGGRGDIGVFGCISVDEGSARESPRPPMYVRLYGGTN